MNAPTVPLSVRGLVSDFINDQESRGATALIFRMDYEFEEDDFENGSLSLVEYKTYHGSEEPSIGDISAGDANMRFRRLQVPCLLRIAEEQLPPLGVWLWKFTSDTLTLMSL